MPTELIVEPERRFRDEEQKHKNIRSGKSYVAMLLSGFASLSGWFLGYHRDITGGIVVMSSFKNDFCVGVYGNKLFVIYLFLIVHLVTDDI